MNRYFGAHGICRAELLYRRATTWPWPARLIPRWQFNRLLFKHWDEVCRRLDRDARRPRKPEPKP